MNNLKNHNCYTLSRNSNRCDVCGARLPRLIDADALRKEFEREGELNPCNRPFWDKVLSVIDNAPTEERIVCRSRDWSNECTHSSSFEQGYVQGYHYGFAKGAEIPSYRKTGKWIIDGHHIRCNRCNEYICNTDREDNEIPNNFCPNCGAKMDL